MIQNRLNEAAVFLFFRVKIKKLFILVISIMLAHWKVCIHVLCLMQLVPELRIGSRTLMSKKSWSGNILSNSDS